MAHVTSSVLGASLTQTDATAMFTLNQVVRGSDGSEWQYVLTTGTLTTGMLVTICPEGTALIAHSANTVTPGAGIGYSLGVTQFRMSGLTYGFVAKRGHNMYIATTGTVAPLNVLYLVNVDVALSTGCIGTAATACTLAGVYITTSASTATLSVMARAILTYPRVAGNSTPLG